MIQSGTSIAVTLTVERWNQVLAVMREAPMPHRLTDPLICDIPQQCMREDRQDGGNVTVLRDLEAGC